LQAQEKEDKIKSARTGVINVLIALIFIRVIDFLYTIAQSGSFKSSLDNLLTRFSKF
jgi:hypothetical protein